MMISREEISALVRRVLVYYIRRKAREEEAGRILFLIPEYPIGLDEVMAEYKLYGEIDALDLFLEKRSIEFTDKMKTRVFCQERKEDVGRILSFLTRYQKVEIYAPSLDFLRMLKDGEESSLFVRILLYFLMTGKEVIIRLPYTSSAVPEGRFGKSVKDLLRDLWDMGVSFTGLTPEFGELISEKEHQPLDLITEGRVDEFYAEGYRQLYAARNAVVTPLALERAKELNIQIINR